MFDIEEFPEDVKHLSKQMKRNEMVGEMCN